MLFSSGKKRYRFDSGQGLSICDWKLRRPRQFPCLPPVKLNTVILLKESGIYMHCVQEKTKSVDSDPLTKNVIFCINNWALPILHTGFIWRSPKILYIFLNFNGMSCQSNATSIGCILLYCINILFNIIHIFSVYLLSIQTQYNRIHSSFSQTTNFWLK